MPPAANCAVKTATAQMTAGAKGHSDINASYEFSCAAPDALTGIDVLLFKAFKTLRELDAQIVVPSGQKAKKLTAKENRIEFK